MHCLSLAQTHYFTLYEEGHPLPDTDIYSQKLPHLFVELIHAAGEATPIFIHMLACRQISECSMGRSSQPMDQTLFASL